MKDNNLRNNDQLHKSHVWVEESRKKRSHASPWSSSTIHTLPQVVQVISSNVWIKVFGSVSWQTHSPPVLQRRNLGLQDPMSASKRFITHLPAATNPLSGSGSRRIAFYRPCFNCRVNSSERYKAEESDKELARLLLMWMRTEEGVRYQRISRKFDPSRCRWIILLYCHKCPVYMSRHHWWSIIITVKRMSIC